MFSAHGHVWVERIGLEHHGDVAVLGQHVGDVDLAEADLPGMISSSPATILSAVVLPQPDGPTSTISSPSAISRFSSSTACVPSG